MKRDAEFIRFVENMFHIYLEKRDFVGFMDLLHDDISWFGVGEKEICHTKVEAQTLLEIEQQAWKGHFDIIEQRYSSLRIANDCVLVYGRLIIKDAGFSALLIERDSRISLICKKDELTGKIKLLHSHISLPTQDRTSESYTTEVIDNTYNDMLIKTLEERTKALSDKTQELSETDSLKAYYHSILNSLPTPLIVKNLDHAISFINHSAIAAIGLKSSQDELIGQDCKTLNLGICGTSSCPQNMIKTGNNLTHFHRNTRDYSITTVPLIEDGITIGYIEAMQDETIESMNRKMLIQKNEELMVADVRYKLAMEQVNIYMFDYIVATKQLVMSDSATSKFGGQKIYENAPVGFLFELNLTPQQITLLHDAFEKINKGDPVVCITIPVNDKYNVETIQQITMTNVYSDIGEPIRAIGIMMDVTEIGKLSTERQYRKVIMADNFATYEVNLTQDKIIDYSHNWDNTIGNIHGLSATKIMQNIARKSIHINDRKRFIKQCSGSTLISNFKKGSNFAKVEYRRLNENGVFIWAEISFTIIRDNNTNDIKMLCQAKDITARKEQEQKVLDEQMFYEAIIGNSSTVYEINVTKNLFIKGHENWELIFDIKQGYYSDMINDFSEKIILPPDKDNFLRVFGYSNVLAAHSRGEKELYCEYRRPKDGSKTDYIWVGSSMQFVDDPITGEVRAISRITDINEKKLWELELLYSSQRDAISGMFNKGTAQRLIEDYVLSDEGKKGTHAFIMFDIDNFKDINDNFGHLFGDAVLSEVSRKATAIFRENDMLGRIGGDEFGILMKNIPSCHLAMEKATELCHSVHETYTTNGHQYTVTISVGVAIFSKDGKTYEELYSCADKALYFSKDAGKNTVTLYNGKTMDYITGKMSAEARTLNIETFSVDRKMNEYVFRILHDAPDKFSAISTVLELLGKHYHFGRVYIFEDNAEKTLSTRTFSWGTNTITEREKELSTLVYKELGAYKERYDKFGVLLVEDVHNLAGQALDITLKQGVRSFVQFAMLQNGEFAGFIGFDECDSYRTYTTNEINDLKNIADIISVFLFELRANEERARRDNLSSIMLERLNCYAFIVDVDTFKIKYTNHIAKKNLGKEADVPCYKQFYQLDAPCPNCQCCNTKGPTKGQVSTTIGADGKKYDIQTMPVEWGEGNNVLVMATRLPI